MLTFWHILSTVALVLGYLALFVLFCFVLLLIVFVFAEERRDARFFDHLRNQQAAPWQTK